MLRYHSSDAVASGDTTETSLGTLTVPKSAKVIVGVKSYHIAADTLTTGEVVSGILRLSSSDLNLAPMEIPIHVTSVLTSGIADHEPNVIPLNIPVSGGEQVEGLVTMDMAETGAIKSRFTLIYSDNTSGV